MTPTTSREAVLSVAVATVLLFAATTVLNNAYRGTRRARAERQYRAGVQLASAGRNAQAADDFRAALVYEHDNADYRLALAKSLIAQEQFGEAQTHLVDLRDADPTDGPVNLMLARIAARENRDADAVTDYHRAIYGFWPDHPEQNRISARFELIGVLERDHQQKQVLAELLELAGELPDSDVDHRQEVASMLLSHGSLQHAAEVFRAIVAARPSDAAAQQGLGEAEFQLSDFVAARQAFQMAAQVEPSNLDVQQHLAACDAVIDLDPTLVRLSANQRFMRAQTLLNRTLDSAERCGVVPAGLSEQAQKALAEKPRRKRDGDTVDILMLSQQVWRQRLQGCPKRAPTDQALAAVMSKLAKQ